MKPKKSITKALFTVLSVLSIVGYGAFVVFAAPPGSGGYNPGETLDPECTPGQLVPEPCIVKLPTGGAVTADNGLTVTGSNVQLGGVLLQNTNIDLDTFNLGINTLSPDHQFEVTGTFKNQYTDTVSGLVSTFDNSSDPLGIGSPGFASTAFDPVTNLTAFNLNTVDGSSVSNIIGVTDLTTFARLSIIENSINASGAANMYLGSGSGDSEGRIHIYRDAISGDSNTRIQNNNFLTNLGSEFSVDADLGVKFDFGGADGFYIFPRADGTIGQVLSTDGSGQLSWANSSSGITTIGVIDDLPWVTDGAQISGSTLYMQSAAPAYFGLVYGNTDTVNTMLGYNVTTGTTNLNQTVGVGDSNVHSNTIIGNSAAMNSNGIDGSDFFGAVAGLSASNVQFGTFIGQGAGFQASLIYASYFNGYFAGQQSENIQHSVYMGTYAGRQSENVDYSVFIGDRAGMLAIAGAENSVFIGKSAGHSDLVNNSSTNIADGCVSGIFNTCYSILIGPASSTNGFSNSIALGASATNTASNQFMIGSAIRPIDEIRVVQTGGTECIIDTSGLGCTSDERLKTNIIDLTTNTLDTLLNVKTVTYNWLNNPDGKTMVGFLAQDLEQYFPELVATNERGQKSVYYSQMTPILVEAIREMNLNVTMLSDMVRENTWRNALVEWFGNAANGITDIFAKRAHVEQLCIGTAGNETCLSKDQVDSILNSTNITSYIPPAVVPPTNDPEMENNDTPNDPSTDNSSEDQTSTDGDNSSSQPAPTE